MSQILILPINKCKLTASWKMDSYKNKFGFTHYGADMVSTAGLTVVYASGDGEVVAAGNDSVVGNVLAVKYPKAVNRATGKVQDVIIRYFHLAPGVGVKKGDTVNKDTKLGYYSNTGSLQGMAIHLHIEADTDTEHPLYSPTVNSSSFLKGRSVGANDKTMTNPLEWLYFKADAPDYQTFTTTNDAYIRPEDKILTAVSDIGKPVVEIQGIDVSAHNGAVDWTAVKAAGKDFVFVRVGWAGWDGRIEANGGLDKRFHDNMKGAIAAGLNVGVYVYSYCKTPAAAQFAACETLELVKPYKLTYPIAFDIEDVSDSGTRYDKMSKSENAAICNAFLRAIQQAGYYPILYTYKSFAESYLDLATLLQWGVWIAQYADKCTYNGGYGIWQYAGETGRCPGVTGACDLNVAYRDYAAINGITKPEESKDELTALQEENARLGARVSELEARLKQIHQLSVGGDKA